MEAQRNTISQMLAIVALVALILSLVLTFLTIGLKDSSSKEFLELTQMLLSWKVIVGSLALAGGITFKKEIGERLVSHR